MASKYNHIFLREPPSIDTFTSTSSGYSEKEIPQRPRKVHGSFLKKKLDDAWKESENEQAVSHSTRDGIYIEFKSDPGAILVTKSLEDLRSKKVRLLNVRKEYENEKEVTYATVYVAHEKKNLLYEKIKEYAEGDLSDPENQKPKNANLLNSIADLRKALLIESFWQDDKKLIPSKNKEWCEVWLSSDEDEIIAKFENLLDEQKIEKRQGIIKFPERTVVLILANKEDLGLLTQLSGDIAEYRKAKETAAFWIEMPNDEQAEWVKDLLKRCKIKADQNVSVCLLDTGVNNGHPLLSKVLSDDNCQSVETEWGSDDHSGHGTLMAGVITYGDLRKCLMSSNTVLLNHIVESVKILPSKGENNPELWGHVTSRGVSLAEIQEPDKQRIICMPVAAVDHRDRGRPTSWSGAVDKISSGVDSENKQLIILCAGNADLALAVNYPDSQLTDSIHDPAQAWNALTVGAYTELDEIKDRSYEDFEVVASSGGLSPFTTTSVNWDSKWPIKPDLVFEGGNLAHDGKGFYDHKVADLSLLSTHKDFLNHHFSGTNMTSAATAQAAWFAAQILNQYPEIWPETIRALMVHSANWTETLKAQFVKKNPSMPSKSECAELLRICGYGVPNLDRALYSAGNSLTLISQEEMQPFEKKDSRYVTREMHLFDLPWPKDVLLSLPDVIKVEMRITLSYFIEPGPGEIGWQDRYRYQSHAYRFDVKSPNESKEQFVKRINKAALDKDEKRPDTKSASDHWLIGANGRDKGSIHSDIWQGSAADLAESGIIAVYPVIGWWRERPHKNKWDQKGRYSLVVSIDTPEESVDIYTSVANKVGITVPVSIST